VSAAKRRSRRGGRSQARVSGFVLTVVDGQSSGREYHFEKEATAGRVDSNDVILVDPGVSREHVRIHGRRGVYLVEDLGSSNGTRLNGELIEGPEVLRDGDYVGIGHATLQFSNLEMSGAGDVTARMRLSEKQAQRLDHPAATRASPKEQLRSLLSTPRGKGIVLGGGLALLLLTAGLAKQCMSGKKKAASAAAEYSATPVDYDEYQARGYWDWAFGYGRVNQNYRDKVVFRYVKPPQKLRVTLEYAAWGIDDPEEVVILVNGKRVGTVPPTRKFHLGKALRYEYDYGLRQEIDPKLLKDGENLITFDNTKNGPHGTEWWEISYVKLRETAIPAPNLAKAKECYYNARTAYEQRNVDPANLQKAITAYECVREYLEELPHRPPMYEEARKEASRINQELSKLFRSAVFDAQQHYRYNQVDKARARIRETMLYFSANKRDPRYIRLRQVLEKLGS